MPRLINELAGLPEPVVLVLDDYHLLHGRADARRRSPTCCATLPRTLQLAIATRADPPLPLARLRARRRARRDPRRELQFDGAEADALLNGSLALGLDAADVELLQERTEGWPAGPPARRRSRCAAARTASRSSATFAGDDRQIGDYLHEVVEDAPPPTARVPAAHLDPRAHVRAAVRRRRPAAPTARRCWPRRYRSNLFVVALDDRGHWFRYHHLLRDLLRRELRAREPELVPSCTPAPSAWHRGAATSTRRSCTRSPPGGRRARAS